MGITKPVQTASSRNWGIDLLRLAAMFYIVVLHTFGLGGICDAAQPGTMQYYFSWFFQMQVTCAVNIFALISGYVGFTQQKKPWRSESILILWLQVVFLSAAVRLFFYLLHPQAFSLSGLIQMFLPITTNTYWYFTAYAALFFLIPLLNEAVRNSEDALLRRLFVILILLFSVYSILGDRWQLFSGFSMLWLAVLYVLGAILKKCGIGSGITTGQALLIILVCTGISWLVKLFENRSGLLLGHSLVDQTYLTPMHLISAMAHLLLFSKLQPGPRTQRLIAAAAPGSFAVYILNCHPDILSILVVGKFASCAMDPVWLLCGKVALFSGVFLVVSLMIDYLRQKFFHLFRVPRLAGLIAGKAENCMDHLFRH